ncbi:MAG: hypothetical protein ACTSXQ_08000 [Alphaproteobacteria bacterium]
MPEGKTDIQVLAQNYTQKAIETLVSILEDAEATASARLSAAQALLDRGWGKTTSTASKEEDAFDFGAFLRGMRQED